MSSDENWPNDPESQPPHGEPAWSDDQYADRPRGMSTGLKVFLILLAVGGVLLLLCCGGLFWFGSQMQVEMQDNPEAVRATTAKIVDIDIPDRFQPQRSMDMNMLFVQMQVVTYTTEEGDGGLVLAQMDVPFAEGEEQEAQIRRELEQRNIGAEELEDLSVKSSETREFEIRGSTVDIQFAEAENQDGEKYREVTGVFPGKSGGAYLMLQLPEDDYNEAEIVEMIESIE